MNLSSIQSLVDVLVELPLPSESPDVVSAASRLITPEQQANSLRTALSSVEQHTLSQSLVAAMRTAKQQLSQLNITFKEKRAGSTRDRSQGSMSVPSSVSFSRNHRENSYMLSVLQQMDALNANAAVPVVAADAPQSRPQNQYWSPWSGSEAQPPLPHSPFVSSPSYPMRGSAVSQTTVVYNDNSNSSSSFSAEPVTPSAMATPPSHQSQPFTQQLHNQQYQQPAPQQIEVPDQTVVQQVEENNYYQQAEPVVVLERSELMEKALEEYYANASNGAAAFCP